MNRFLRAGILLLILSCLIGACAENLIRNPEFDQDFVSEGISFWDVDLWDNTADVTFDVEKIGIYNCLHIAAGTDNDVRWIQTVPVEPDTEYRLSGYILAQNCSEDDGARGANLSVYNSAAYSVSVYDTAGEWQYVELYGKTGPDQTELVVCARIGGFSGTGSGEAWFRDIELEEDSAPTNEMLTSFATYSSSGEAARPASVPVASGKSALPERKTLLWIAVDALFAILFIQAYFIARYLLKKREGRKLKRSLGAVLTEILSLLCMLALAIALRVYFAYHVRGYLNDVDCFLYWGHSFRELGFRFYANAAFHDYPPLYMMLLGGVDALRETLGIAYASQDHVFLIKLIPMFSDLVTACFIYGICRRRLGSLVSVLLMCLIALNPAYIADSAAWGQVDSLLALLLVLTVYFGIKGRWYIALPVYALAILTKPQALMFGPIGLIAVAADAVRNPKRIRSALIGLGAALAVLALVSLPFAHYEFSWAREYSVTQPLREAAVQRPDEFIEEKTNYLNWYNDTFPAGEEENLPDGKDLNDPALRTAFSELEKAAAFTAEYYLLQGNSTNDISGEGFDAAEAALKEKLGSEIVFWDYFNAQRLDDWQQACRQLEQKLQEGGELTDSEWLLLRMYDNVLCVPGLSEVLASEPVSSRPVYLLTWLWNKLMGTAQSYEYVTVNACNLYVILGKNWARLDNEISPERMRYFAWFMVGAAYLYASVILLGRRRTKKKDETLSGGANLALAGAVVISILFSFAPMMHERYLFPAIALSLLAYCQHRDRRILWYCAWITFTQFLNIALVLEWGGYSAMGHLQDSEKVVNNAVSALNIASTLFLCWTAFDISLRLKIKKPYRSKSHKLVLRLSEVGMVALITALYSVLAFANLGETNSPVTGYTTQRKNEQIVFDLGEVRTYRLTYYGGISNNYFTVALSNDGVVWTEENAANYGEGDMYKWIWYVPKTYSGGAFSNASFNRGLYVDTGEGGAQVTYASGEEAYPMQTSRYVRFTVADEKYYSTIATQKMVLNEVAFIDAETGKVLPVASVSGNMPGADLSALIDEQDAVASYPSYYNGMIFDEIYHARTAYELLNGYESDHILEWSHPHLGKLLIAVGIKLFGMTPFGWRFSGALIGALMLPLFYLFIRQLGGKRASATFGMLLLALDSMHFTQTRIATVDSYAVFFILLMYLFMIRYYRMDLFRVKLWKQLLTLLCSGIAMGLACASKWIGVYAAAGLALLFFIKMGLTLHEYCLRRRGIIKTEAGAVTGYPMRLMLTIDLCVVAFILVPLIIYYFSYYWHFAASGGLSVEKVWQLQQQMYNYHANIVDNHYFKTPWYEWPIIVWPMWYFSSDTAFTGRGVVSSISLMGNPAVWWSGLIALIACTGIWLMQKKKDSRLLITVIGFASQYLPWVLVPRSTYIYHYFASVPFIIAATALVSEYVGMRSRRTAKWLRFGLVIASLILFAMFYPLESGYPCSYSYAKLLRWFDWYNFQLQ
ncbi:MAG: phospholipid carrier-dependent glycosyltransferase [Clostridia bacterium]|nr:phospholipid carrier-dependent glycosyltransferase [Clostridia bacterium]